MTNSSTQSDPTPHLRRERSLVHVSLAGVGIIFGAGIYVRIGEAAEQAGSLAWLSFVIAALLRPHWGTGRDSTL